MATAKKRQDGELSQKIREQVDVHQYSTTSSSSGSISPTSGGVKSSYPPHDSPSTSKVTNVTAVAVAAGGSSDTIDGQQQQHDHSPPVVDMHSAAAVGYKPTNSCGSSSSIFGDMYMSNRMSMGHHHQHQQHHHHHGINEMQKNNAGHLLLDAKDHRIIRNDDNAFQAAAAARVGNCGELDLRKF